MTDDQRTTKERPTQERTTEKRPRRQAHRQRRRPILRSTLLLVISALVALAVFISPVPAFSQSCALCYTQAASSTAQMIQALRSGILILIVPPTLMSVGMIAVVYRKRNQVRRAEGAPNPDSDW
jgi:uncharacterized membrane protein